MAVSVDRVRYEAALGLASIANRAYSVALVVYIYDATHSAAWLGAAAAARYLPGIATSLFTGSLFDRTAARLVLVWANTACAFFLAAMAAAILGGASPSVAIGLAALVRIAASVQGPAEARLLQTVAAGRDLSHLAARQAVVEKVMLLAGPAIGGLLLIAVSPSTEMISLATLSVLVAIICLGLPQPSTTRSQGTRPARSDQRVGSHATSGIGVFVAIIGLSGFIYGTDTVLLAVFANTRLHLGNAGYGELFAGLGAGSLIAAPFVNQVVRTHRLTGWLALGIVAYCLPSVAVAHSHNTWQVIVLEAVRGFGSLIVDVVALTELQRVVLPQGLPLLTSRLTSIVFAAVTAGALLSSEILRSLGTTGAFTALGLIPIGLVVAAYPFLHRVDVRADARFQELRPRIALLEGLGLLQAISPPVLERLAADMTKLVVPAQTTVIAEHDPADAFYIVRSGDLDVFVGDRQVNSLHAGEWFGEIGLLEGSPRTATVRTRGETHLYRITGNTFLEAFTQLPPSPSMLDSVSSRLANGRLDIVDTV